MHCLTGSQTTNVRHFYIVKSLKTKILYKGVFFSYSAFKELVLQTRKKKGLSGKKLTRRQNFNRLKIKYLQTTISLWLKWCNFSFIQLKTFWRKGKKISFFQNVFERLVPEARQKLSFCKKALTSNAWPCKTLWEKEKMW